MRFKAAAQFLLTTELDLAPEAAHVSRKPGWKGSASLLQNKRAKPQKLFFPQKSGFGILRRRSSLGTPRLSKRLNRKKKIVQAN